MSPLRMIRSLVFALEAARRHEQAMAKLAVEEIKALRGQVKDAETRAAIAEAYIQGMKSKEGRQS